MARPVWVGDVARDGGVSVTAVRSGTTGASVGGGGGVVALPATAPGAGEAGAGVEAAGVSDFWAGVCSGVGSRMKIAHTRAMIDAALSGALDAVAVQRDSIFNLDVPTSCPGVPAEVLNPRNTWTDKAAYDAQAKKLAKMFVDNFKTFEATASPAVKAAGPKG